MKQIKGLSQIQTKYDAFFIDLWGVTHNGIQLYEGAIKALKNLIKLNKRYVLMSNAPRPSKNVENFLLNLNMDKNLIRNVFTSGEAARKSLERNYYGKNFYHLGPKRDSSLFEGFEKNSKKIHEADYILCTGFLDEIEDSLDLYKNLLKNYIRLKMICTNPDLTVHRGDKREYCAGKLAEIFKKIGGEVIYFGKPYPEIYNFCINDCKNILVIGDNINTDIRGANNMKFDSLLITSGVHKEEFESISYKNYDKVLKRYGVTTSYYQEKLIW